MKEILSTWSKIVQHHSLPEMEWSSRFSVGRSIRASGICDYKPGAQTGEFCIVTLMLWSHCFLAFSSSARLDQALELTSLTAWAIIIRLLEDDDDSVRNEVLFHPYSLPRLSINLAYFIQAALLVAETVTLSSSSSLSSSVFSTFAYFSSSSALLSPTAAYELAFTYFSEHFSSSPFYLLFLLQLLGLENSNSNDTSYTSATAATEPPAPLLSQLAAALLPAGVHLPAPEASAPFSPSLFEQEFAYLSKGEAWGNFGNILFEKEADNWCAACSSP